MGVVANLTPHESRPDQAGTAPAGAREADALAVLAALLDADIRACNHAIVARMDSPVALIPQLAAHIVAAG